MLTDKELKKKYKEVFKQNPDKSYPVGFLKKLGFTRNVCSKCGTFFWNLDAKRKVCGNAECSSGFTFIGKTPAKRKFEYTKMWAAFAKILAKNRYKQIKRYPVVARWRDDIHFVEASIDDFIPYVVKGEIEPPANPLIVPQICLRFNDIDNVGITGGAHYTSFIMVGQHRFEKPEKYDFNKYLEHLYEWFSKGLKMPDDEITFHEDVWAGSGNFGPCIEIFSRGLELANQVYMQYRQTESGYSDLELKVLDMGLGYERNVWFSQGKSTSYDTTFPTVMDYLRKKTGISQDKEFMKAFLPYSSLLNIDETENIDETWRAVADTLRLDAAELRQKILPAAALYSIAEHTRALIIAITDGMLPSNIGGGYNLRVILRRALSFIYEYGWEIDLAKLCEIHAHYLKPLFPEFLKNIGEISEVLKIEEEKFTATRQRTKSIAASIVKNNIDISEDNLISLYESQGISPELIIEEARSQNKDIKIPENLYARIAQLHTKNKVKKEKTLELNLDGLEKTKLLFYENMKQQEFDAKVLRIIDNKYVILDQTCFYGRAGGQEPDTGYLNNSFVYDVEKISGIIVHLVENPKFREGDTVHGKIDWEKRMQHAQHHTAVHIINGAARKILGNHIWQAGAHKSMKKAHIDITHYKPLAAEEIEKIEKTANNIVKRKIKINKKVMERSKAEKEYSMRIYQGGAIPEKLIRINDISAFDVEACSGTHLDNTHEVGKIIITSAEKIQDGIIRITIVAGSAAEQYMEEKKLALNQIMKILGADENNVIEKTKELFEKWKAARKNVEKSSEKSSEELASKLSKRIVKNVLVEKIPAADGKVLQKISKALSAENRIIILFGVSDKIYVFGSAGEATKINIGEIIRKICEELDGRGGGMEKLGQGVGINRDKLDGIIKNLWRELVGIDEE